MLARWSTRAGLKSVVGITLMVLGCAAAYPVIAAGPSSVDEFVFDEFGKSRLWNLDVPRADVEAVVGEFMNAYNAGDIERMSRLFAKKVITDRGPKEFAQMREDYSEHFLATVARYLNLRNARWQKAADGVMSEVDFSLREQSKLDGKDRDYTGAVRFYLSNVSGKWKIAELYFAYDPPPEFVPRKK